MKKAPYNKGNSIKAISAMPEWIIKIIGRLDSNKSPEVATAHIDKYLAKLASNENDEALLAESTLSDYRANGQKHLYTIIHTDVNDAPNCEVSDNTPAAGRAYAAALAKHKSQKCEIANAKSALLEIDAAITSGNLIFEERLEKTRNVCMRQIDAYIKGVRSGKNHNFDPEINFDDTARLKYYDAHKVADDLIHKYAKEGKI